MKKVLIVDEMYPSLFKYLEELNLQYDYLPKITREEIIEIIDQYFGLIIRSKTTVDEGLLQNNTSLQFVARAGAGIDNIDQELLLKKSIHLIAAAEGNRDAVGEHTTGLILALLNNIVKSDREVRNFEWKREENRGKELSSFTVGILGYGNMGEAVAKRMSAFTNKIICYDKYKQIEKNAICTQVDSGEFYEKTEILSVHIPLTDETLGMINTDYFNRYKNNLYFINTARGEIAEISAIAEGIKTGKIVGAALDVLQNEKLKKITEDEKKDYTYLFQSDATIFTPHIAGWSFESYEKINQVLISKIQKFLDNVIE
ncbi:MAG: phosphoglycerate dehydrogenase [Cyclobacteriaceae bacterium]|nr:phosphoglycerate dehydrogenase [Cyclobacteriaceae bacterium]